MSQPSPGSDPDVTIRCGTVGSWELLEEYEFLDDDTVKFQVGQILDKENFTSVCPYSTISVKDDLINMPFWSKLSDDERAMFMILALGCFGSLTGLACTYFLSPYVSNQPEEESEDEMVDVEPMNGDDENPSLRRFNLLTGEVETSERHGRAGGGLAHLASTVAVLVSWGVCLVKSYLPCLLISPLPLPRCASAATAPPQRCGLTSGQCSGAKGCFG